MAAKDWAEDEFPAASDAYPARRRVRRMGRYLKQPAHIQRFICGVWGGMNRRRAYLCASTRAWRLEAEGLAAIAARDAGDRVSTDELDAARLDEHLRRRARRAQQAKVAARAKARAYRAHWATRASDRQDVLVLRQQLAAALDA